MGVVCSTYNRPQYIGQIIRCFLDQDYQNRELIILDDAGQYENMEGDRWRLVSTAKRYATLGEKRNAAVKLLSPDVEAFCSWDDDDLYLPWTISACAQALEHGDWAAPSVILKQTKKSLERLNIDSRAWCVGAAWALSLRVFWEAGGYGLKINGEDEQLRENLIRRGIATIDPVAFNGLPYFVWCHCEDTYRTSTFTSRADWDRIEVAPARVDIDIPKRHPASDIIKGLLKEKRMLAL